MPLFLIFAFVLAVLKFLGYIALSWTMVVLVGLFPRALFLVFAILFGGLFLAVNRAFR